MARLEAVVEAFNAQQYALLPDRSVRTEKGDYFPDDDGRRPSGFMQARLRGQTPRFIHLETATVRREYTGQPIDDGQTAYGSDLIARTPGNKSHSINLMLWPLGNDQLWAGTPAEDSCIGQQHGGRLHVIWVGARDTIEKTYEFTHPEFSNPQIVDVSPRGPRGAAVTVMFTQHLHQDDPAARGRNCDIGSPERHLEKRIDLQCGQTECTRRERVIKVAVGCPEVGGCD